jgi:hypothetical protein
MSINIGGGICQTCVTGPSIIAMKCCGSRQPGFL